MKLNLNILENNPVKQAEYLCFLAKSIVDKRYQSNGFFVLPYLVKNHSKTIHFPDLNYSPSFWKAIKNSKNNHYGVKFPSTAVKEAKNLLKSSSLIKNPINSKLKKSWPTIEKTLTNLIQNNLKAPHLLKSIDSINLLPCQFGTESSYHPTKQAQAIHLNLTHRLDFPASNIIKIILLSLQAINTKTVAEIGQINWHQRNATINFILNNIPSLKKVGQQSSVRITKKIIKDSQAYLNKLGFPQDSPLSIKNNQIYLKNSPVSWLTSQEKHLLILLIKHQNQIVSFDQAAETIWQEKTDQKFSLYALSKLIENLRKKITLAGINHQTLITKRSQGYLLLN